MWVYWHALWALSKIEGERLPAGAPCIQSSGGKAEPRRTDKDLDGKREGGPWDASSGHENCRQSGNREKLSHLVQTSSSRIHRHIPYGREMMKKKRSIMAATYYGL